MDKGEEQSDIHTELSELPLFEGDVPPGVVLMW